MVTAVPFVAELHVLRNPDELFRAAAEYVVAEAGAAVRDRGRFVIALSGGSTPRGLFETLGSDGFRGRASWEAWHVFWGDERAVPSDDERSNYRTAKVALLDRVPIPRVHVHRVRGEMPLAESAAAYEREITDLLGPSPAFDLVLLGVGADGHTASLFPGDPALDENRRLVVPSVEASNVPRVTFTLRLINSARAATFLATGADKAPMVRRAARPTPGEKPVPAGRVALASGNLHWFLTPDAAAELPTISA